jgi:hypothetical protein
MAKEAGHTLVAGAQLDVGGWACPVLPDQALRSHRGQRHGAEPRDHLRGFLTALWPQAVVDDDGVGLHGPQAADGMGQRHAARPSS